MKRKCLLSPWWGGTGKDNHRYEGNKEFVCGKWSNLQNLW